MTSGILENITDEYYLFKVSKHRNMSERQQIQARAATDVLNEEEKKWKYWIDLIQSGEIWAALTESLTFLL